MKKSKLYTHGGVIALFRPCGKATPPEGRAAGSGETSRVRGRRHNRGTQAAIAAREAARQQGGWATRRDYAAQAAIAAREADNFAGKQNWSGEAKATPPEGRAAGSGETSRWALPATAIG